jgi:hypothetical protein
LHLRPRFQLTHQRTGVAGCVTATQLLPLWLLSGVSGCFDVPKEMNRVHDLKAWKPLPEVVILHQIKKIIVPRDKKSSLGGVARLT